ncbi:MAG: M48 family metallopeptidase [Planctomycetota bacterium]|jgi:Zn-dependent protease with chaperone function|nr:M48 family metallopeptidase [Planctomycetota bacterium]
MAMNFFEHQEKARRSTGRLVILFILAVVAIIAILYFFFAYSLVFLGQQQPEKFAPTGLWQPYTLLYVAGGTLLCSGLASLIKISSLSSGGSAVAEMVGAVKVNPATSDPQERKYINVVEEMAIASGVPVPAIYIMQDEININAFAAGYTVQDAAVAVTRGCIDSLDRDELQGVVAHEFSHILNGDMSLNIRLIGVLAGILFIAVIGRILLEVGARSGGRRSRSKEGGGGAALLAIGLALFLVGYIGYFFGSLIKAAVSRQREFLADASAVQFTRNPGGIGGALRQIGGYADGELETKRATEVSHMCFSSVVNSFFSFKTHPPLPERISRIENLPLDDIGPGEAQASGAPLAAGAAGLAGGTIRTSAADVIASTGSVTEAGVEKASHIVASLPAGLAEAAQHPLSASALVYLLILPENKKERRKMVRTGLPGILGQDELGELSRLEKLMPGLDAHARLPLLEMTAPALRTLTKRQAEDFLKRIDEIIKFDTRVDLREFCYATMIDFCLHGSGKLRGRHKKRYRKIKELAPDFSRILSVLSDAGQDDSHARQRAFTAARKKLDGKVKLKYEAGGVEMTELRSSVGRLARSTLGIRKKALMACSHCVLADGIIEVEEAELLRAFAHALGIPVPPFLASTDLAGSDED